MEALALFIMILAAIFFGQAFFAGILQLVIAMIFWMFIGNIAGYIVRGEDYGVAGNMALGLAGGIFGSFVLRKFGFAAVANIPLIGGLIAGVFGAVLLIFLVRLYESVRDSISD